MTDILAKRPFAGLGCAILFFCDKQMRDWQKEHGIRYEETCSILEPLMSENSPDWNVMLAFHECLYGILYCAVTKMQMDTYDEKIRGFEIWRWDMEDSGYRVGDTMWPSFMSERIHNKFSNIRKWVRGKESWE